MAPPSPILSAVMQYIYNIYLLLINSNSKIALQVKEWSSFILQSKQQIRNSIYLLSFALPNDVKLGTIGGGQHVEIKIPTPDISSPIIRSYTVISNPNQTKSFEIIVKRIDNGNGSIYLCDLAPGKQVEIRGPFGELRMLKKCLYIDNKEYEFKPMNIIGAGTGNTPFISILYMLYHEAHIQLPVHVLSVHASKEIDFTDNYYNQYVGENGFHVAYHYTHQVTTPSYITVDLYLFLNIFVVELLFFFNFDCFTLQKELISCDMDSITLLCGPARFCNSIKSLLQQMNYNRTFLYIF